eukprot:TRINITY_DN456_c0_g1_i2.p1 TRINITY_DN456_c0_g1~~TRINITY_DN456_c0_g1_i2.p1  ORF type:complete len:1521 (+),score=377.19 TRINITY_DN456_c0_g1_i2:100-4662(+)
MAALISAAALLALGAQGGRKAGAQSALIVDDGYVAVPGGLGCPRDCGELDDEPKCRLGAKELGLPCDKTRFAWRMKMSEQVKAKNVAQRYAWLQLVLRVEMHGTRVERVTAEQYPNLVPTKGYWHGLVNTELIGLYYWQGGVQQHIEVSNKTDDAAQEIYDAMEQVPTGKWYGARFKGGCKTVVVNDSSQAGGCTWQDNGLVWNRAEQQTVDGLVRDVMPWQQGAEAPGKFAVPGQGSQLFRICKCSQMPKYVAVVHAKCAPSCRRGYDPCSQHVGCKRISDWDTCKAAANSANWNDRGGAGALAENGGKSVPELWAQWNANFETATWRANRGTPAQDGPPTAPICTSGATTPCTSNPMWRQDFAPAPGAKEEWTVLGMPGGEDRLCDMMNDTATDVGAYFENNRWLDARTGAYSNMPPPPVNFLGDPSARLIPQAPEWSQYWNAPTDFLAGNWNTETSLTWRPQGCSIDGREELGVFYPWQLLKLRAAETELQHAQCCAPGTHNVSCFVQECTLQPCLAVGADEDCEVHSSHVNDTFVMCECTDDTSASNDECVFYGQPCGAGQDCVDPTPSLEPVLGSPRYQCSCNGATATGAPVPKAQCSPALTFVAKPSGRGCGTCARVVTQEQCNDAASSLQLPDKTSTIDPIAHRYVRPCGCHYSEHGARCTSDSGECLRFNPTIGNGVYNGCDAYETSDAHDFIICACNDSFPQYVAEPVNTCRGSCKVIDNKQDCRTAAEFIGMHLAVHEEQEALLLLDDNPGGGSKALYPNYTGIDMNEYQHHDNGLGPVVGDGPARTHTRPPGCHYRRRYDADILPDGSTVNWPHLLFNKNLSSTLPASTVDWLICDCSGNVAAPTPMPTHDNAAWGALRGFQNVGAGPCTYGGQAIPANEVGDLGRFTFQSCIERCLQVPSCRGIQWSSDPEAEVDMEGLGQCILIGDCPPANQPCPITAPATVLGTECWDAPMRTPAPTPVPTYDTSHGAGPCDSFCCSLKNREDCCFDVNETAGLTCGLGAEGGGYCWWSATNLCDRNCHDRDGPCAEIELCFNITGSFVNSTWTPAQLAVLGDSVAKDSNLLIGGDADAVQFVNASVQPSDDLLTMLLRCPSGGCGSFQYIVDSLCFNGYAGVSFGDARTKVGTDGICLKVDGAPSVQQPKDNLAGLQPVRVTASPCNCTPPVLGETTQTWNAQLAQWETSSLASVRELVSGSEITPAFTDAPPLDVMACVAASFQGMQHYRTVHTVSLGTQFNITCPDTCTMCDVVVTHLHNPPCSSNTNGGWPSTLPLAGWKPFHCAPCLRDSSGSMQFPMVGYHHRVEGGKSILTPPVETSCLAYFGIFAGPGVFCEDNALRSEELCVKAGGRCAWRDGACVTEWCPPRPPSPPKGTPPAAPVPGAPSTPNQCVPAPGSTCANVLSPGDIEIALAALHDDTEVHGAWKLLSAGHECASDDMFLSLQSYTVAECAAECKRTAGCQYFIFGNGGVKKGCYWEFTTDACATEGFEADQWDFYSLTTQSDPSANGTF